MTVSSINGIAFTSLSAVDGITLSGLSAINGQTLPALTFPTTSVLDTFNRANEGPPPSANWTSSILIANGGMQVSGNQAFGFVGAIINSAWWSAATFGPDCEAYITLGSSIDYGGVMARLQAPGTAGVDGYYAQFYETGQQLFLKRIDNSVETVLLTVNSFNPSAGDSIGISAIGTTIELWYKVGAGAWTSKGSVTDATYGSAGNIGMTLVDNTGPFDNFGGGTR